MNNPDLSEDLFCTSLTDTHRHNQAISSIVSSNQALLFPLHLQWINKYFYPFYYIKFHIWQLLTAVYFNFAKWDQMLMLTLGSVP
jgi:hypothetical protein